MCGDFGIEAKWRKMRKIRQSDEYQAQRTIPTDGWQKQLCIVFFDSTCMNGSKPTASIMVREVHIQYSQRCFEWIEGHLENWQDSSGKTSSKAMLGRILFAGGNDVDMTSNYCWCNTNCDIVCPDCVWYSCLQKIQVALGKPITINDGEYTKVI